MITEFTAYESVFMHVMRHNWDDGPAVLQRNLDGNYCDRGTALLIYWSNNPGFFYGYELQAAVKYNRPEMVALLLEYGANKNVRYDSGRTLLNFALMKNGRMNVDNSIINMEENIKILSK